MKHNLLLSYGSYISFYILLRIEGKSRDHPIVYKMADIKQLLDGLTKIDDKVIHVLTKFNKKHSKRAKTTKVAKVEVKSQSNAEKKKSKGSHSSEEFEEGQDEDEIESEVDYDDEIEESEEEII